MVGEYRNDECCKLVKEYESMVQGELFDAEDGRGNPGAYLESREFPEKLQRCWVTGDELESLRKEIRERKRREILDHCYWNDHIYYDESDRKFYCGLDSCHESFSGRFEFLEKDADYSEYYSVADIVDFLKADGGGRMMILSSIGDYELDGVLLQDMIKSVLWCCSLEYIIGCLWDEIDFGKRFWYRTPNGWIREKAVFAIAEMKRLDPYPYMGHEDRKRLGMP